MARVKTSLSPLLIFAKQRNRHLFAIALMLGWCCGGDPTGVVTMNEVAGAYVAITLEREVADGTIDELARGAMLNLTLSADGSTSGRLFIPAENDSAQAFDADLGGTWSLDGPVVRLVHPSETFLVDVGLLFSAGRLVAERSTVFEIIRVVLTR